MAKIASSLKNMVIVLFVIAFVSGLLLAYVQKITLDPIAKVKQQKQIDAIAVVVPAFDNNPLETAQEVMIPEYQGEKMMVYTAINQGDTVGYAILSSTNSGFGGKVEVMIGFKPDGTIYNTAVTAHQETPGLGDKMTADKFRSQFIGFNCDTQKARVKKDGGDVDALTAATISSRAFCSTVNKAFKLFCNLTSKKAKTDVDAKTFATKTEANMNMNK